MKIKRRIFPDSQNLNWTNGTATAVASGDVVIVRGEAYVAETNIAVGASGALDGTGEFDFPSLNTDTWAAGQSLGWDIANKRLTPDLSGGAFFTAITAKTSGETKNRARINNQRRAIINKTLEAGDINTDTTKVATLLGFTPVVASCFIRRSNAPRLPGTITFDDTNSDRLVVTGGGTALAANDVLTALLVW